MRSTREDVGSGAAHPGELIEVVDGRTGVIRARGRLTGAGADLLRGSAQALQGLGHRRVVVDLRGVDTLDAEGLRELLALQQEIRATGSDLVLVDLTGPIGGSAAAG
jgi:anti-anti-sigma regulatory factor